MKEGKCTESILFAMVPHVGTPVFNFKMATNQTSHGHISEKALLKIIRERIPVVSGNDHAINNCKRILHISACEYSYRGTDMEVIVDLSIDWIPAPGNKKHPRVGLYLVKIVYHAGDYTVTVKKLEEKFVSANVVKM